ncbi:PRAME family member 6-like [Tenrec ecaudatus]|uniref:PRAME family member 6-like n=1 Tax=Tenrec ecaudatus TaxID=94439 RepID=UPI003F5A59AA
MPSSLLDLSVHRVLQDEATLLEALEWLPSDLFPPLFKVAVLRRQSEIVKAMTVVRDVCCFAEQAPDEVLTFLIDRLKQRKALPQLWCKKLEFVGLPPDLPILEGILTMVQPDSVQELKVEGFGDLQELNVFSPFLAQTVHLHTLFLANCSLNTGASGKREDNKVRRLLHQFSSQLLSVSRLRHLTLQSVTLLGDYLCLLLRFLQAPLEILCIRHCILGNPDLTYLSSLPCTSNLRSLELSAVRRAGCHYKFLPALLKRVSATLESLDLADRGLHDSDLTDLLPALCTCSQLRSLMLCGNLVSMAVLQHLLALTLPQCTFTFLQLPVPLHCYVRPRFALHQGTLEEVIAS